MYRNARRYIPRLAWRRERQALFLHHQLNTINMLLHHLDNTAQHYRHTVVQVLPRRPRDHSAETVQDRHPHQQSKKPRHSVTIFTYKLHTIWKQLIHRYVIIYTSLMTIFPGVLSLNTKTDSLPLHRASLIPSRHISLRLEKEQR